MLCMTANNNHDKKAKDDFKLYTLNFPTQSQISKLKTHNL